ncbi:MAG: (2Fe-2S)-binding protein [Firmicutes bacterium]|nr:(2Fe-2S)-binding protein [Bacillota bacterium]
MESYGCNCDCQSGCQESLSEIRGALAARKLNCPVCGGKVKKVSSDVVNTFANKKLKYKLRDSKHYICLNPTCKAAYFSDDKEKITVDDIRRPIWFKKGADPVIICYCNNITKEQIKEAVREHGLKSWEKIVLHYRKGKNCACNKLNPTGECCTEHFYEIVNETLDELGKERVNVSNQCCG